MSGAALDSIDDDFNELLQSVPGMLQPPAPPLSAEQVEADLFSRLLGDVAFLGDNTGACISGGLNET